MKNKDKRLEPAAPLAIPGQALRRRAEEIIREKVLQSPEKLEAMSPEETRQILHELLVHQIQLDMQNEELRQAQMELDAARERYFDLYDLAPVGYCTLSEQGLIMETNLTAANLLGVARGVLTKQPISRFILKADQDIYYLHRQQLFKVGEPQRCELRMVKKDGTVFWAHLTTTTAQDPNGAPVCRLVLSDITDRKKAEAALLKSEERFSKAFHCNPQPMFITTLGEGCYVEVNDNFVKTFGYERNEIIGRTVFDSDIWANLQERDLLIEEIRATGYIGSSDVRFRTKSREIRTILLSTELIDVDGDTHLLWVTNDITESKRMEVHLRLSEESFSKAFNASPIGMTITSLEDGKFIKANKAFCEIWGCSYEEILGKRSLEIGFWRDPADRNLVIQRIMANQSVKDMEIGLCKKNGEQRLGLYSAEGIVIDGEPCILSVLTDITDLRQMEVEMTRLDRLNLVGEMAASIGHEIRNPMTTVRGYLQIMRENKDYVQEIEFFDLMIEELDRANSIITEFLSLAKNKMFDMIPRNLNSIISNSFPLIQAKAMSQDQYIKLEMHDLPNLLLDNKEICQLILNLVNNGMESMSSAGEVTIRTFVEKEEVVLAVQDEGHGIESGLLDKLGTPFFTTKEQGTGLGLAVCYRIANRHNAKVDINTSSNGTTFYIRFPIPKLASAVS
jgi:PAS domain S-box-containing protein